MRGLAALTLVGAVAACGSTPGADYIMSLPPEVQTAALQSCHADLGIAGPFQLYTNTLDSGAVIVAARNGNGVTIADARSVNQCAQARLLSERSAGPTDEFVIVDSAGDASSSGAGTMTVQPATVVEPQAAPVAALSESLPAGCPVGASVIYGGSRYCLRGGGS